MKERTLKYGTDEERGSQFTMMDPSQNNVSYGDTIQEYSFSSESMVHYLFAQGTNQQTRHVVNRFSHFL
jgi:hypothetical protein